MWKSPSAEAGLAVLKMFKVFQRESIYCLGKGKKALAVLQSEMWKCAKSGCTDAKDKVLQMKTCPQVKNPVKKTLFSPK